MFTKCSCCGCKLNSYYLGPENCFSAQSGGFGITRKKFPYQKERGKVYLQYQAFNAPDKFTIFIEGEEIITTGFVGDRSFDWGIPLNGDGLGCLSFDKPENIEEIEVEVEGRFSGTEWEYNLSCLVQENAEFFEKEFKHFVGNDAGEIGFRISLQSQIPECFDLSGVRVLLIISDFDNPDNILYRKTVSITEFPYIYNDTFYKPEGISNLLIQISNLIRSYTTIELAIGCPTEATIDEDDITRCLSCFGLFSSNTTFSNEKSGPDRAGGIDSRSECRGCTTESGDEIDPTSSEDDFVIKKPPTTGDQNRNIPGGIINNPPNGYFPPYNGRDCFSRTFTNYNEPLCYSLSMFGNFISSSPNKVFYYTSRELPLEPGKIILQFRSDVNKVVDDSVKQPKRQIYVAAGRYNPNTGETNVDWTQPELDQNGNLVNPDFVSKPVNLMFEILIDNQNKEETIVNRCIVLDNKPNGFDRIVVYLVEDNPDLVRANFSLITSCLLDNNLFQANPENYLYRSQIFDRGSLSGVVDFYASIYMVRDIFVGCFDENNIAESSKDLPKALFKISNADNNDALLEFVLDASVELDNIPVPSNLNKENTFVDKLTNFFKNDNIRRVKVEVFYTRNTAFRYTIGCPRVTCFAVCGFAQPDQILVELEGEDYEFYIPKIGCDVLRKQNPANPATFSYLSLAFDSPYKEFYLRDGWSLIRSFEYDAEWNFYGRRYNGEFLLQKQADGVTYKYVFNGQEAYCNNDSNFKDTIDKDQYSSIELTSGEIFNLNACTLNLNNIRAFWKFGFDADREQKCDSYADYINWSFYGQTSRSGRFAINCDHLYGGNGVNQSLYWISISGTGAYIGNFTSIYDAGIFLFALPVFPDIRTIRDPDPLANSRNEDGYSKLGFGGNFVFAYAPGQRMYEFRSFYTDKYPFLNGVDYIPFFQLPSIQQNESISDWRRRISRERGKPFLTIKRVVVA